jgi:hypothetical protein
MLRDYMTVLNILMQNETASFADIVGAGAIRLKTAIEEKEEEELGGPMTPTVAAQSASRAAFDPNDIDF